MSRTYATMLVILSALRLEGKRSVRALAAKKIWFLSPPKTKVRLFFLLLLTCVFFFFSQITPASAQRGLTNNGFTQIPLNAPQTVEQINSFHSDITINQNTSVTITETIEYQTQLTKHGIYRYIPVRYNKNEQVAVLPVSIISVTDEAGKALPYTLQSDSNYVTLKIGDPDLTFTGKQTYVISYTVQRAINHFPDNDELYWDITGEGWEFPVFSSSATITSEFAAVEKVDCFSGKVGGDDQLCISDFDEKSATFSYESPVSYGENFTVLVGLNTENQLVFPTAEELRNEWLKNHWTIALIPFPSLIMFFWWFYRGRDEEFISQNIFDMDPDKPKHLQPISFRRRTPMVYEPLKDLTPGEAGALLHQRATIDDIIAELLEIARKKHMTITLIEKKRFLFGTSKDYLFNKTTGTKPLTEIQGYLLGKLFKTKEEIKLSELKGKFYLALSSAQSKLNKSLEKKKVYPGSQTARPFIGAFVAVVLTSLVATLQMNLVGLGIVWPLILTFLLLPIGLFFAHYLPRKTAIGTNFWYQARGLKASIQRGAWREKIKEQKLFIEEVLPFAVALGVVDQLSKDMEVLGLAPPEYIHGDTMRALNMINTADFVNSFRQSTSTNLSYNPSSTSYSGSSGFSGGGSSGGGGGGGGGGSW